MIAGEAERERGGEDQDEDERALNLPPEQAQRAETLCVLHAVWADDRELLRGTRRREPVRTRSQRRAEIVHVATPIRCGGVRNAHAASPSSPERIRSIWRASGNTGPEHGMLSGRQLAVSVGVRKSCHGV